MTFHPAGPGLVDGYRQLPQRGFDEMLGTDGSVRPAWDDVAGALELLGTRGLEASSAHVARVLDGDGVVYRSYGVDTPQRWRLDPLPLLLDGGEWLALEAGLTQRARLLDALVTDLYGQRSVLQSGLLPPEVVFAHSGFLREVDQIRVAGPHQLFTVATDLARDGDGGWVVLHDRAASPSGAGFAMENRRVISKVLPDLYHRARINRLAPFFNAMRLGLQEVAASTAEAPRVVLLSSGPMSETAYDQAFLSQLLGYPLVSGTDLYVREGRLMLRGIEGPEQVDVVLRRVDSDFCDPLELRADSQLGIPGLVEAARLGSVAVVNGLGSGVLENPGLMPFLPALCWSLLGEALRIPSANTWWCGDPASMRRVRSGMTELVLKPLSRGVSRSSYFGWELSEADRATLLARIEAEPHLWVGQQAVAYSTAPTLSGTAEGAVAPRTLVLRSFAVAQGGAYHVLPGGLVRVGPEANTLLVSSQAGALTKDAWVITSRPALIAESWTPDAPTTGMRHVVISPRMAEDFFWLGRYTERAESAVRLLRSVRDRTADFTSRGEQAGEACLDVLLEALTTVTTTYPGFVGLQGEAKRNEPHPELWSLLVNERRPGTVAHSVQALTNATRAVRDQLSGDTWLVLGGLDAAVADLADTGAHDDVAMGQALTRLLSGLLALSGLAAESMVRDLSWRFLEAGRRVERAQQVVALLRACLAQERPADVDGLVVESLLLSTESILTYRRRYASRREAGPVLELLLVDRENPRSVAHALDRLSYNLSHVPNSRDLCALVDAVVADVAAVQPAALVRNVDATGRRVDLEAYLEDLHTRLRALAVALEGSHFEDVLAPASMAEVIA